MLTVRETAERLGVEASSIRRYVKAGKIPGAVLEETSLGPHWLIPESALGQIERRPRGRPPKPRPAQGQAAPKKKK